VRRHGLKKKLEPVPPAEQRRRTEEFRDYTLRLVVVEEKVKQCLAGPLTSPLDYLPYALCARTAFTALRQAGYNPDDPEFQRKRDKAVMLWEDRGCEPEILRRAVALAVETAMRNR